MNRMPVYIWGVIIISVTVGLWLRTDMEFNTPYIDESDYLFVGRLLLSGIDWPSQTYIFSSNLPLYILGVGDKLGGVVGGRGIITLFSIASLYFYYRFLKVICHRKEAAQWGVLLLSIQAPHIFISKFATYDMISMAFFCCSLFFLSLAIQPKNSHPIWFGIISALLLCLSIFSKYITLVYALLFIGTAIMQNRKAAYALLITTFILLSTYVAVYFSQLRILYQVQLLGTHAANTRILEILKISATYAGLLMGIWLWVFLKRHQFKSDFIFPPVILLVLLFFAIPLIFYHIRNGDMISLYKHITYTVLFLTPVAGILIHRLTISDLRSRSLFAAILIVTMTVLSFTQVKAMEKAYPNTESIIRTTESLIDNNTTILSENPYLFRHAFYSRLPLKHFFDTGGLDNDFDGVADSHGILEAVWDGKIDLIYLNGLFTPELDSILKKSGALNSKYDLILELPYQTSSVMNAYHTQGTLELYRVKKRYSGPWPLVKPEYIKIIQNDK